MSWYDSNWKERVPVSIDITGGGGTSGTYDVELTVPKDWDRFWDNIRSDAFDAILVSADNQLLTFKRSSFTYSTRVLSLAIDNLAVDNNDAIHLVWLYFNNSSATDLTSSFTPSTPKQGLIFLGTPNGRIVSGERSNASPTSAPQTTFQKTTDEKVYIWFQISPSFSGRVNPYNKKMFLEGLRYIQGEVFGVSGSSSTLVCDETKTKFIEGWVGLFVHTGTVDTNYTVACKIFTTLDQVLSLRCGLEVRNKIPV